ncbi:MAG: hypothetical protein BWZ08_02634 [candidate division BRC1 bacterium ADurb.BinA292]|nr:MAG: hypothetical protein BWZ08_02634 [candidate division BRC1 bacterium ADurb.BinA292]
MTRDETDRQPRTVQHHRVVRRARPVRENLGVPRLVDTRHVQRRLRDRRGRDGPHAPGPRRRDRHFDIPQAGFPIAPRRAPRRHLRRDHLAIDQHRRLHRTQPVPLQQRIHRQRHLRRRQLEHRRRLSHHLIVPDQNGPAHIPHRRVMHHPQTQLGADPRRVPLRDRHPRLLNFGLFHAVHLAPLRSHYNRPSSSALEPFGAGPTFSSSIPFVLFRDFRDPLGGDEPPPRRQPLPRNAADEFNRLAREPVLLFTKLAIDSAGQQQLAV